MPRIADLDPADLAVFVRAAPELLVHLAQLAADGFDLVLQVVPGIYGSFDVVLTGLRGDLVVAEQTVTIRPRDDAALLVLIGLVARQAVKKQERWWRKTNAWLRARGLPEVR